jgi:hypothetical protein
MGRYPEAEDRNSTEISNPDSTVVDLESYRRRRDIKELDTEANQEPRPPGGEGAGARNTPVEGNKQD